jgi:pilus assembly protein CpaE
MSHRLLLAIGDDALASSATALAAEGEELEVVERVADPEELTRALRRLDLDVVVLHDELSGVAPIELAREIVASFPDVGVVLIAEEESPELLRAAMQAGIRDVISLPLSLEQLEASARAGAMWSRALRDRVAGEDGAGGVLGGQLVAVCGAKGGVGTTTVALHVALAAARSAPGRPVCVVDFDLQNGDFRTLLDTPYRRSVVDLVEVAGELSVRHLQETLYTHPLGVRVLFAPDDGERAEEIGADVARSVLTAVKARHALTVVDLGATVSDASAVAAEIANKMLVVTTPDVLALRGVRRLRELWRRLQVREADEDVYVVLNRVSRRLEIQPDLARKVVGGRMAETTLPADFAALEAAVNTGSPARLEDGKLRGAIETLAAELDVLPSAERDADSSADSRGLLGRLSGERGQTVVEFTAALPILALLVVALWQIGLIGFTYVIAGHAAREGARELAVDPSETPADMPPYRQAARDDLPSPWRQHAHIFKDGEVTVKVTLRVPLVLPGVDAPWRVKSQADTSVESEPLPPRQAFTPTPTPTPTEDQH